MKTHDDLLSAGNSERLSRVSAQYETQRRQAEPDEAPRKDRSQSMVELPCGMAPAVRRRFAQRPTH
jgi:hypothetical protein